MVKFVRGKVGSILLTGGLVVGAILVARHFNLGSTIAQGAFGLGKTAGEAVSLPFGGLVEGVNTGLNSIFASVGATGDIINDVRENLDKAFKDFFGGGDNSGGSQSNDMTKAAGALEIAPLLTESAISRRIEAATQRALERPGQAFGGFESAQAQETALQRAIRESKEKFPQFFK